MDDVMSRLIIIYIHFVCSYFVNDDNDVHIHSIHIHTLARTVHTHGLRLVETVMK